MSQGWSTPRCSWPRGRNPRRNSPGWRRFEVSQRRARSSRPQSRLPRSRNFLKPRVALISSNVAAAASIMGASRRSIEGSSHRHPSRYGTALARSREAVRAERGYSNCWCMWWRLRHRDFRVLQPAERKAELRGWVRSGAEPGLIAYREGIPVGWCAVAPRSEYAGLAASRSLKPVDSAAGVWSVTCYFVARGQRRTGLMAALLGAAESHAKRHGGLIFEGYPVAAERLAGCAGYTGVVPAYERAGFRVVARPSRALRIMRKTLRPTPGW